MVIFSSLISRITSGGASTGGQTLTSIIPSHRSEEVAGLAARVEHQRHGLVLRVAGGEAGLISAGQDRQQLEAVAGAPDGEEVAPVVGLLRPLEEESSDLGIPARSSEGSVASREEKAVDAVEDVPVVLNIPADDDGDDPSPARHGPPDVAAGWKERVERGEV